MNVSARARQGLSPISQLAWASKIGWRVSRPRFAGVSLRSPDRLSAWGISHQIAGGEYDHDGFAPRPGDKVVDVGANIGIYALWAVHRGAASVVSYEPGPDTFPALQANVAGRPVRTVHAAVVGQPFPEGVIGLYIHPDVSTRNTITGREIGSGQALARRVEVPAIALEDTLAEPVSLLKVDCEGAEFDQFEHVTDSALRRVDRIMLEFHRSAGDPARLLERLDHAGFRASILDGGDDDEPFGVIGAKRQ